MASSTLRSAVAALLIAGAVAAGAPAAQAGGDFQSAVAHILMNQHDGPVSRLSKEKKRRLIVCVNSVLADLPNGKKRFILRAADFTELEQRFGKVVMENRAEWKQKIARGCAHIVV